MQLSKLPLIGLIVGLVGALIAVIVVIGVSVLLYKRVFQPVTRTNGHDLIAGGREAEALILEARQTGLTVREQTEVELLLKIHPLHQQPFEVRMRSAVYRLDASLYQPGAMLKVKYDPADPSRIQITSTPVPGPVGSRDSSDSSRRLEELERLKDRGLVTEEEYLRKRQEIIKDL
jgi:hypothetical protein